jgi:3,4-dihydroxy 2-butanone 4-phosphate synthase
MSVILNDAPIIFEPVKFPFEVRFIRAVKDLRRGNPVILVDDFDRENEADLIVAAEQISTEATETPVVTPLRASMLTVKGVLNRLSLFETIGRNSRRLHVSSVKHRHTIPLHSRISMADRVTTIRTAIANNAVASDLTRPGHVFPLRAAAGGVLERQGHTEGSVELARLAGLKPAAVLCELTNPNGTMAKGTDIETFAARHNMVVISIAELVDHKIRVLAEANA